VKRKKQLLQTDKRTKRRKQGLGAKGEPETLPCWKRLGQGEKGVGQEASVLQLSAKDQGMC